MACNVESIVEQSFNSLCKPGNGGFATRTMGECGLDTDVAYDTVRMKICLLSARVVYMVTRGSSTYSQICVTRHKN